MPQSSMARTSLRQRRQGMDLAGGKAWPQVAYEPLEPTALCSKVPPSYVWASLETWEGSVK
jgi:hypothetical protein